MRIPGGLILGVLVLSSPLAGAEVRNPCAGAPVRPLRVAKADKPAYTGKRVSLDVKGVSVRRVIEALVGVDHRLNLVLDDSVGGTVTLRVRDLPWDEVLDAVLRTRDLRQEREGNIVRVAPAAVFAAEERREAEARGDE